MTGKALDIAPDGAIRISGRLTFATAETVRTAVRAAMAPGRWRGQSVTFDLGAVEEADSAGLALLVEWRRAAHREGGRIHFRGTPPALRAIAGLCGVENHLFGQDDRSAG